MHKKRLVYFLFLILGATLTVQGCSPSGQATDSDTHLIVDYRISKTHGLVNFVQTVSGDHNRSPLLVELFEGSEFDNPETRAQLKQFNESRANLGSSVNFDGFPPERHMGLSLEKIFLVRSAFASDLEDLQERTIGLLPLSDHKRLFESLEGLRSVYERLVWNPHLAELEEYLGRIESLSEQWGLNELFHKAAAFYRAAWPADTPFVVTLYPLPGHSGRTNAESIGSLESVGVLLEESDLPNRFGVIFHEMCHSLYEAQPSNVQLEFERYFVDSDSLHARLAYQQINEALATALGNGLAYRRAAGQVNEGSWYDDPHVDVFAKAIHPMVEEYLDENRPLDQQFVEGAIIRFAELFPDAIYEYAGLLNKILLMADGRLIDSRRAGRQLGSFFRVSSVSSSTPIDHERSLAGVQETGETLLVLVAKEERSQLVALAAVYPPLAEVVDELLALERNYVYSSVDAKGRAWVVVQVDNQTELATVFQSMKESGKIDPHAPLQMFDR